MESLKKSEIKELLDNAEIQYKSNLKKSELIELLKNMCIEEEEELTDIEEELTDIEEEKEEVKEEVKEEIVKEKELKQVWHDTYHYIKGEKIMNERTCNYTWEYV